MTQRERIEKMEAAFDRASAAITALTEALEAYRETKDDIMALKEYYGGGDWLRDYEDDEAGRLPMGLKRGVLSQDGLFDMLDENDRLMEYISGLLGAKDTASDN